MPFCFETISCPIQAPWDIAIVPYTAWLGDFFFPIVWGIVLAVIYLQTKDPMMTSFIGLLIAVFFTGTSVYTSTATGVLFDKAYLLMILALGSTLYFLFRHKATNPGY